jgi:hypothetical protein
MEQIATLEAELDKHRWIPVAEGLPKRIGFYDTIPVGSKLPRYRWYSNNKGGFNAQVGFWREVTLPSPLTEANHITDVSKMESEANNEDKEQPHE